MCDILYNLLPKKISNASTSAYVEMCIPDENITCIVEDVNNMKDYPDDCQFILKAAKIILMQFDKIGICSQKTKAEAKL